MIDFWSICAIGFLAGFLAWLKFCYDMRILMFKNIKYKKNE